MEFILWTVILTVLGVFITMSLCACMSLFDRREIVRDHVDYVCYTAERFCALPPTAEAVNAWVSDMRSCIRACRHNALYDSARHFLESQIMKLALNDALPCSGTADQQAALRAISAQTIAEEIAEMLPKKMPEADNNSDKEEHKHKSRD